MGNCLSCCEADSHQGSTLTPGTQPLQQVQRSRGLVQYPATEFKELKRPVSTENQNQSRVLAPPTEKKMFPQYTKIPPLKKQGNGETKRLSFVSKDISEAKILQLYEQYKDPVEELILAEGIEHFCQDLEVKPEEFIVLLIAWNFKAETMCKFTKDEFVNGCKNLKVDSIKSIRSKFPELEAEMQNKQSFKHLYKWTYKFCLDNDSGQRTLPVDVAISLWKLVFTGSEPTLLEDWLEFLEKHPTIKGIPKDTWDMFLNFVEQVGDDLSTYDDTEAWPSLLDDFVEHENDKKNQNVKTD
ncbi:DCN1-like protein 3 [Patella vulgata]|uniref:DCN1-like protein 3 n=1 Tax=Patella vulgata TaxID=6465 RepID=UPI00217F5995|nr:DCN1-like protein 3 [Patella vulgata]